MSVCEGSWSGGAERGGEQAEGRAKLGRLSLDSVVWTPAPVLRHHRGESHEAPGGLGDACPGPAAVGHHMGWGC